MHTKAWVWQFIIFRNSLRLSDCWWVLYAALISCPFALSFIILPQSRLAGSCRQWGELWSAPLWLSCRATWSQQRRAWKYEAPLSLLSPAPFPLTGQQLLSPMWWWNRAHPIAAQLPRFQSCKSDTCWDATWVANLVEEWLKKVFSILSWLYTQHKQ